MINKEKWINSLPNTNKNFNSELNQLDHDRWVRTISKKNTFSSIKKYTLTTVLFVVGLLLVSVIKNETRNLQKEINNLKASIYKIKFNLDQSILDNEVLTSPENISQLAKENLNTVFIHYNKSQIKHLDDKQKTIMKLDKKIVSKKNKSLTENIKSKMTKKIETQKEGLIKVKEFYSDPKLLPSKIKTKVVTTIYEQKMGLRKVYTSPREVIDIVKVQKWTAIQIVKAFLGIPVIPGR